MLVNKLSYTYTLRNMYTCAFKNTVPHTYTYMLLNDTHTHTHTHTCLQTHTDRDTHVGILEWLSPPVLPSFK